MCKEATESVKQMQKVFGYMNTQLLEQAEFLAVKRAKRYVRSMTEMSNEQIQFGSEIITQYTNLSNTLCEIFTKISTQEEQILDQYKKKPEN